MARSKRKLLKKRRTRRYKKQKGGNKFKLLTPLVGGLGNRLYEIIAGIGFAEKWNMEHVINKKKVEASDHLNEDSSLNDIKQLIPSINIINEDIDYSSWATLNEKTEDGKKYCKLDNPNNNCVLYGFFQHEKYFPPGFKLNFVEPTNNIIKGKDNIYFIHFRFGDYGDRYIKFVKYYKYSVNELIKKTNNPTFIIISDDIDKSKNFIKDNLPQLNDINTIYDNNKNRLDSLYYLASSKGGVCSYSTFCRIGAFFMENKNKDLIFFPKPLWPQGNTYTNANDDDSAYPDWVTIVNLDVKI